MQQMCVLFAARMMQVCILPSFELVEMLDQVDDNTMCENWFVWS
jgi:hypothetical protein